MLNINRYNSNQMLIKVGKLKFESNSQKMLPSFEKRCCPLPDRVRTGSGGQVRIGDRAE